MKCELCQEDFKNIINHKKNCEKTIQLKNTVINLYLNECKSIKEINQIVGISKNKIIKYLNGMVRNSSESSKLGHKKFPNNFKHSDETKKKMREKHLEWMKNNPDKTAWRTSNFSYPEKLLFDKFLELKWDEKYLIVREKSVFPYFLDFAFENEKVDVEIDGSQHLLPERKKSDDKKDKLLIKNGWSVIRITANEVNKNIDNCISKILYVLDNNLKPEKYIVGILKYPKRKNKFGDRNTYFNIVRENNKINIGAIIEKIKKSNIDFSKQGWVKKVSKIIGINESRGGYWMKKNMFEFYDKNCWKRDKKEKINYCKCGKIIKKTSLQCKRCSNLSRKRIPV